MKSLIYTDLLASIGSPEIKDGCTDIVAGSTHTQEIGKELFRVGFKEVERVGSGIKFNVGPRGVITYHYKPLAESDIVNAGRGQ